jgi:ribonucleoside-diphosphate reductase alpha chain
MSDDPRAFLDDEVDPENLDTEDLIALIEAANGTIDEFVKEGAVTDALDDHSVEPDQERPHALTGTTQEIKTGYDHIYVNINTDQSGDPVEVFTTYGQSGGFTQSFTEAIQNLATLALRHNADPEAVANELRGIHSPKIANDHGERVTSIPDAIGLALERVNNDDLPQPHATTEQAALNPVADAAPETEGPAVANGGTDAPVGPDAGDAAEGPPVGPDPAPDAEPDTDPHRSAIDTTDDADTEPCPECHSLSLYISEGCKTCQDCGWSEC